ncbi:MAG TPA: alpha-ketoglutarate-dependent dioxygenase AlkB [Pseudomonadales bacterium]|nr:alpha-ketoglutarate-dependent dioxygenase AlkB [Pseudomonadales bacterium]
MSSKSATASSRKPATASSIGPVTALSSEPATASSGKSATASSIGPVTASARVAPASLPPGVRLIEDFVDADASAALRARCLASLAWERPVVRMFGRTHPVPRELAFVAPRGLAYAYSGIVHEGVGVPDFCTALLARVASTAGAPFDAMLLTHYRDGEDRLGWHADDEAELGPDPVLAILSLGASRTLRFRHRPGSPAAGAGRGAVCAVELHDGALLLMGAGVQRRFEHEVPRRRGRGARLSIGFRVLGGGHARP